MNTIMIESDNGILLSDKNKYTTATHSRVNGSENISEEARHILSHSIYVNPRRDKYLTHGDRNQIVVVGMETDLEGT